MPSNLQANDAEQNNLIFTRFFVVLRYVSPQDAASYRVIYIFTSMFF